MFAPDRYETSRPTDSYYGFFTNKLIQAMTWAKDEMVLDFGCGTGRTACKFLLPKVKSNGGKILGVDISEDMINYAKTKHSDSTIEYAVANIMDNDFLFQAVKFDKVFSVFVLHWMEDYRTCLKRMYDLLKPGGQMGFVMSSKELSFEANQKLKESSKWGPYMKKQFCPRAVPTIEVESALDKIGFKINMMEVFSSEFEYKNLDAAVDFFASLNPALQVIPRSLHNELKQEYRQLISEIDHIDTNSTEPYVMKIDVLYAVVRKPS